MVDNISSNSQEDFRKWLFGKYIEYLINEGYPRSVAEWSQTIDLPRSVVSMLLAGSRNPSKKILEKLSKHYGEDVWKFIQINYRPPKQMLIQQVRERAAELSPEERKSIISELSKFQ